MYFKTIKEYENICKHGNYFDMINYFKKYREKDIENHFVYACKNGYLHVAKWILEYKPITYNYIHYTELFQDVCYNGHIEILQWLLLINPNIKIWENNECAFYKSCQKGHLHIVKWLLSIRPSIDIYRENDRAFKITCYNGHVELALWFCSQNIKYQTVIDNNKLVEYFIIPDLVVDENIVFPRKNESCPICYEHKEELQTNCGHQFCTKCISKVFHINKNCRYCREEMTIFYKCVS